MVSMLASSAVDRGFEPRSGKTKDWKFGICCFSTKHTALRLGYIHCVHLYISFFFLSLGRHGRDCMVVWFTTTYAISAYHHWMCLLWVRISIRARCTTLCDKVCQFFANFHGDLVVLWQKVCLFVCLMVFNATFNNISVISWWSVLLMDKTTDLSQVTDKLYHIMLAYHHWMCLLWVRISIRARCTTLCDKVCQWLVTGQWFCPSIKLTTTMLF
jgi:hypothetical protein